MAQDAIMSSVFGQFVWNLHNQKIFERSINWRHKIIPPSYMKLDLPPLKLLDFFSFADILQQAMHWELYIKL